ncbi:hypothetical protein GNE08_15005 [Trichormus variabilis ARAD]|uniref:Uncharacterized protein n=1 Tax=Trichormus variabilis N2B TaxID=2681315 RepID=A0ABR6S9J8_ANAVA|nr:MULTISPECIES: hypothetical protein [Nostocaceae]MBC1215527.1 hypothetical protein [Trichormus variabilis ARAD]MBC1254577.1 hypothetical protein [Trichormus variabilis V5]MBC1269697.1 hypothetical protein [Trichormus variabilis FSR]MBC1303087.1 hypothetical protein [Trichormus variabilis N2B]MBC1314188.1 hypothetical protein [Trichormus variabilis PNB]
MDGVGFRHVSLYKEEKISLERRMGRWFGINICGDRTNGMTKEFTVPSYLRTDAALFYRSDRSILPHAT